MILILAPNTRTDSTEFRQLVEFLDQMPNIRHRVHQESGEQQLLTEIYLIGDTANSREYVLRKKPPGKLLPSCRRKVASNLHRWSVSAAWRLPKLRAAPTFLRRRLRLSPGHWRQTVSSNEERPSAVRLVSRWCPCCSIRMAYFPMV